MLVDGGASDRDLNLLKQNVSQKVDVLEDLGGGGAEGGEDELNPRCAGKIAVAAVETTLLVDTRGTRVHALT